MLGRSYLDINLLIDECVTLFLVSLEFRSSYYGELISSTAQYCTAKKYLWDKLYWEVPFNIFHQSTNKMWKLNQIVIRKIQIFKLKYPLVFINA